MRTNKQILADLIAANRLAAQEVSPARKRLERLHRQCIRRALRTYQGYSLRGTEGALVHFTTGTIQIGPFGGLRRVA